MREKITLPVCGLEVELAALEWDESKSHFQKAVEAAQAGKADEFMEAFLKSHYPKKVWEKALKLRPDALALYNDTVRYNFHGPESIKNSSRSGTGAPTQTETPSAEPAGRQTTKA